MLVIFKVINLAVK